MLFLVLFSYIINFFHTDDNPVSWVLLHEPILQMGKGRVEARGHLLIVPHLGTVGF